MREQHGVVTRRRLLDLGFSAGAIRHRLERDRLHRLFPGVYAVGRPDLTQHGRWMAAVLLREVLGRRTFSLTDSPLERRFLPLARRAGPPKPQTQAKLNEFDVDF